jgi:2-keto-4-pentenoate hydratase
MATTIRQELDEEFLSTIRKGQELTLEALKHLVEAVHYVIPTMPVVRVPLASRLPTAHEVVADRYEFAKHLLANQRKFADEVITATSPMLPGRAGPKRVTAKAA